MLSRLPGYNRVPRGTLLSASLPQTDHCPAFVLLLLTLEKLPMGSSEFIRPSQSSSIKVLWAQMAHGFPRESTSS